MIAKCCNPECEAPFNYREGRLIRFSRKLTDGKPTTNQIFIQHFWLCGKCAELYVFEYEPGSSIKIKPRHRESSEETFSYSDFAAKTLDKKSTVDQEHWKTFQRLQRCGSSPISPLLPKETAFRDFHQ